MRLASSHVLRRAQQLNAHVSMSKAPLVQGVLAVNKPSGITSVDVLRTLQEKFSPSALFAPLIKRAAETEANKSHKGRRSRAKSTRIKIGHGGTLDPLATGVLIAGIGDGTKSLSSFLACTKTYETVVVFGVATDTYDVLGQVTTEAKFKHIDREAVQTALEAFRGSIKQKPPAYSARWMNGQRLYDLARRGEEIPDEALKEKDVQVDELVLLDFYTPDEHKYTLRSGEALQSRSASLRDNSQSQRKRKRDKSESPPLITTKTAKIENLEYVTERRIEDPRTIEESEELMMTGGLPKSDENSDAGAHNAEKEAEKVAEAKQAVKLGPAARIRMTVSTGFYVRSLCHDLGKALNSAGFMAELIRTRQADFEVGKNVLEYEDLKSGEEHWAETVRSLMLDWKKKPDTK